MLLLGGELQTQWTNTWMIEKHQKYNTTLHRITKTRNRWSIALCTLPWKTAVTLMLGVQLHLSRFSTNLRAGLCLLWGPQGLGTLEDWGNRSVVSVSRGQSHALSNFPDQGNQHSSCSLMIKYYIIMHWSRMNEDGSREYCWEEEKKRIIPLHIWEQCTYYYHILCNLSLLTASNELWSPLISH